MARSTVWRRTCPDNVRRTIEELQNITIYLLHQSGPTGFVVKMETTDKKYKVLLGDVHHCTCPEFMKTKELCTHILWILLKKLRLSSDNPLVFQLGLIEREINDIVYSRPKQIQSKNVVSQKNSESATGGCVQKRPISADDVCPICQEELLGSTKPLTYCRTSCGQSVHLKCMKIWADHQRSNGEESVKCPLCREEFGPYKDLQKGMASTSTRRCLAVESQNIHADIQCVNCGSDPITGRCFKCSVCSHYFLCQQCFNNTASQHSHDFVSRMHSSHHWRSVETPAPPQRLPAALVRDLEQRDITEQDYDLLLQLDRPSNQGSRSSVPHHILMKLPVEPLDRDHTLLRSGQACNICMQLYARGEWVKKLPCGHQFHRECADSWLSSSQNTCPLDGLAVHDPQLGRNKKKKKNKLAKKQVVAKSGLDNRTHSLPELLMVQSYTHSAGGMGGTLDSSHHKVQSSSVHHKKQPELLVSGLSLSGNLGMSSRGVAETTPTTTAKVPKRIGSLRLPPLSRQPTHRPQHRSSAKHLIAASTLHASSFVLHNSLH